MLKAAIIGCGNIAGGYDKIGDSKHFYSHAKSYQSNKNVELTAAFDPDKNVLGDFCVYWKIEHQYTDLEEMLKKNSLDIVSICSPNQFHCEQIKKCADAGVKTILCEKPISYSSLEAEVAIDYCKQKNVALIINYLRNWDKMFLELESDLKQMQEGELETVHVNYNKGVFHNASHLIHFFLRSLGRCENVSVIDKSDLEKDALCDFVLGFERCSRVYFFNHRQAKILITELDFFFKSKRIRIEGGGQSFIKEDYATGNKTEIEGTIHSAMKNVIDDVVSTTLSRTRNVLWDRNLNDTIETTKLCEKIVHS
jgi:hypothetical protein